MPFSSLIKPKCHRKLAPLVWMQGEFIWVWNVRALIHNLEWLGVIRFLLNSYENYLVLQDGPDDLLTQTTEGKLVIYQITNGLFWATEQKEPGTWSKRFYGLSADDFWEITLQPEYFVNRLCGKNARMKLGTEKYRDSSLNEFLCVCACVCIVVCVCVCIV